MYGIIYVNEKGVRKIRDFRTDSQRSAWIEQNDVEVIAYSNSGQGALA